MHSVAAEECKDIPAYANGAAVNLNGDGPPYEYGDVVELTCEEGYELTMADPIVLCGKGGMFSGSIAAVCKGR